MTSWVYFYTRDSINIASIILWQHAKEKGQHYKAKSFSVTGQVARVEQEGETTGQTMGRERKKSETTGTKIITVIVIYKPLLGTG